MEEFSEVLKNFARRISGETLSSKDFFFYVGGKKYPEIVKRFRYIFQQLAKQHFLPRKEVMLHPPTKGGNLIC